MLVSGLVRKIHVNTSGFYSLDSFSTPVIFVDIKHMQSIFLKLWTSQIVMFILNFCVCIIRSN